MSTEPTTLAASDSEPENLVEVGTYRTLANGLEHGLVVLAMGQNYWLVPSESGFRLLVEPIGIDQVERQLRMFDVESVGWPPQPLDDPAAGRRIEMATPVIWALVTLGVFWAEAAFPTIVSLGEIDARAVLDGKQWWRCLTALLLHSDTAHLLSNAISGIFVFSAVTTAYGRVRGWLLLGAAGVLGNAAAALANRATDYHSIGASTAVFAAVGILAGRSARRMATLPRRHRWRALSVPLAAGAIVVALYGAGGVHVDVLAHLTGFLGGVVCGLVAAVSTPPIHPRG